jgi:hypothetical protein
MKATDSNVFGYRTRISENCPIFFVIVCCHLCYLSKVIVEL